jgi:ubiquinone/menaquinone biosynthesis C-methylase UbiE
VIASPTQTRCMFGRIAPRCDLVNTLLSLGQHRRWKRLAPLHVGRVARPRGPRAPRALDPTQRS